MSVKAVAENADESPSDALAELRDLLGRLDLPAKVRLLTGSGFWTLHDNEDIGLRSIVVSDGPAGVRGVVWDEREPSLNLPSGSSLGATWDESLARAYGDLLGREARAKGVDVVLGPTINLHRSPYGGRHFEAVSEDPLLTARLAASYVEGLQAHGVAACLKHFVANDYEIERNTASSEVSDQALREVYLAAFERAVVDAGAWMVMSAYNRVNGTTMSEHPLLRDPLKSEWGFDGVVVSDWVAVSSTEASANSGQDLVMPDMFSPWEDALVAAVREGRVAEETVDDKVLRLLLLATRVGALEGHGQRASSSVVPAAHARDVLAGLCAEGMVLLENDGTLPLVAPPSSVALIGPNAWAIRTQGGGSATVTPEHVVSPLEGLTSRFPTAEVTFRMGIEAPNGIFALDSEQMYDPIGDAPGIHTTLRDTGGRVLVDEVRQSAELTWLGTLPEDAGSLVLHTRYTPTRTERCDVGIACAAAVRVEIDGVPVIDTGEGRTSRSSAFPDPQAGAPDVEVVTPDIAELIFAPPVSTVPVELVAGRPIELTVTCDLTTAPLPMVHAITVGMAPRSGTAEEMLLEAVQAASRVDVAVVVVGTSSRTESEGFDRTTLALPGDQDRLVEAVAAANPRTVVVVNSGSPVLMPWRERVGAVLVGWFGGQEMGTALAEVIAGDREPGGRLPTTWPADERSVPIGPDKPVDGLVNYAEGVHIGHRAWLRTQAEPAYWFGHGLGYTTWALTDLVHPSTAPAGAALDLEVTVENTGDRPGKQVIQAYLSRQETEADRPVRWLAGHTVVRLGAGERSRVRIRIDERAFATWTPDGWWREPGMFGIQVGTSAVAIALTGSVVVAD
ncbi:beta-glucosidase family protein [Pimelobacter simplex]|uniref:beta-glucosidase family protein n=1 Tax=Nocardioides simplex TaxID=2045 RepID=UPI0019347978|nr:glycoside hydrolase family 3 protein [Pimelobacter simplex]